MYTCANYYLSTKYTKLITKYSQTYQTTLPNIAKLLFKDNKDRIIAGEHHSLAI
jgi:hypothetical protein